MFGSVHLSGHVAGCQLDVKTNLVVDAYNRMNTIIAVLHWLPSDLGLESFALSLMVVLKQSEVIRSVDMTFTQLLLMHVDCSKVWSFLVEYHSKQEKTSHPLIAMALRNSMSVCKKLKKLWMHVGK